MIRFCKYGVEMAIPGSFVSEVILSIALLLQLFGLSKIKPKTVSKTLKNNKDFLLKEVMKTPF